MNRQVVVLAALIGFASLMAGAANAGQGESDKLQGTWMVMSFEVAGKATPAPPGSISYTFNKARLVMKQKGRADTEGAYKLDASKTPKQMDWISVKATEKEVMEAIYELNGDTLKLAYSVKGPKGKRPTAFDSKEAVVIHLKREKLNAVIAETGFNIAGDTGWATPWGPVSPRAVIQKKVVFKGEGALHLSNTGFTRRFAEPQKGRFVVEQHVQVPKDGGFIAYIRNGEGPTGDGPVWRVANGKFFALKEDAKWLETPFASEAGKWHKVVVTIDVSGRSWEFSVDDRMFKSPQPLPFRSKVDQLDTVRYLCENVPGIYIDEMRILRSAETAGVDPYAGWQAVEGTHEGLRFSLRIPSGWKWKDLTSKNLAMHHAIKEEGVARAVFFSIDSRKLDSSDKKVSPEEAAKLALQRFLSSYPETEAATHLAKSVIKVGELDAAWFAEKIQPAGQPVPTELKAFSVLQTAGYEVYMSAVHLSVGVGRTAKEFDVSQAEFLKIAQSFRVVSGKAGK